MKRIRTSFGHAEFASSCSYFTGVKRFRTFGMMKYLKDHFTNE